MEFKLRLTNKRDEAEGTKTFFFAKPEDFSCLAGQYIYLTLPELHYEDKRGNIRHFTLSSSPTESHLSITSRIRQESGYKKTLDELDIGSLLDGRGPQGTFTLASDTIATQQVMVAGGIGITPFRSIIKYVSDKGLTIPIHLIYSNSLPEEITFKEELDQISQNHPNIKITYTVTKPEQSKLPWQGLRGRVDAEFVKKIASTNWQLLNSNYWLCGPPLMVNALEEVLNTLQIPVEQIEIEKFTGYN